MSVFEEGAAAAPSRALRGAEGLAESNDSGGLARESQLVAEPLDYVM